MDLGNRLRRASRDSKGAERASGSLGFVFTELVEEEKGKYERVTLRKFHLNE